MESKTEVILPNLNVNTQLAEKESEIAKSDEIVKFHNEISEDIREDRKELTEAINVFMDMVMNDGDSSNSSKEALVNLLRLKSETADRKTKVLDLLLRAYLKERDGNNTKFVTVTQNNSISGNKRDFLKSLEDEKTKAK